MIDSYPEMIADLAFLALFLISITAVKYVTQNTFERTRFLMSALFVYIVASLTVSFWHSALSTVPFVVPAFVIGVVLGEVVGVRTERQKIFVHGIEHYMERFAHISSEDVKNFTWWSFVNFYSVCCVLLLINLIGFSTVILHRSSSLAIATSVVGAALIGSIVPYLIHLWRLPHTIPAPGTDRTPQGV